MNANGLQSSQSHGVGSFRVTQLDHSQGPVDGSLYAQVRLLLYNSMLKYYFFKDLIYVNLEILVKRI